jgi:biopolymer transport protein ExbB
MSLTQFTHIAALSGGVLYVLALVLLVALTIIVDRTWALSRMARLGAAMADAIARHPKLEQGTLEQICDRGRRTPHAVLAAVPLNNPYPHDPAKLEQLLEEAIMLQAPVIDRRLWVLDTAVTLAPLLGLLGTIIGMFEAFQVLGDPNSAPVQITDGIAEALVATAAGLFIAILGLVFFNGLNKRVRIVLHQMETIKVMLVNRLGVPRASQAKTE